MCAFSAYLCSLLRLIFIQQTHEGSHREISPIFPTLLDIVRRTGAKRCSNHMFRGPPAYPAQLLTLHRHRADSKYKTANEI